MGRALLPGFRLPRCFPSGCTLSGCTLSGLTLPRRFPSGLVIALSLCTLLRLTICLTAAVTRRCLLPGRLTTLVVLSLWTTLLRIVSALCRALSLRRIAVSGITILRIAVLGVTILRVAVLGIAVLGIAVLGIAILRITILRITVLGIAVLRVAILCRIAHLPCVQLLGIVLIRRLSGFCGTEEHGLFAVCIILFVISFHCEALLSVYRMRTARDVTSVRIT